MKYVAEEVGFEPTVDFHLRRFSRPVHSTALPLLRQGGTFSGVILILKSPKCGPASQVAAITGQPNIADHGRIGVQQDFSSAVEPVKLVQL